VTEQPILKNQTGRRKPDHRDQWVRRISKKEISSAPVSVAEVNLISTDLQLPLPKKTLSLPAGFAPQIHMARINSGDEKLIGNSDKDKPIPPVLHTCQSGVHGGVTMLCLELIPPLKMLKEVQSLE
jgi:hypothetical protein